MEWKQVPNYPNYWVSDTGLIKNKKEQILKPHPNDKYGHLAIGLSQKGFVHQILVHRLVAMLFIPNPNNKPHINHLDGNPGNNNVSNLEWCTHSENMIHRFRILQKKLPTNVFEKMCWDKHWQLYGYIFFKDGTIYSTLTNQFLTMSKNHNSQFWFFRVTFPNGKRVHIYQKDLILGFYNLPNILVLKEALA